MIMILAEKVMNFYYYSNLVKLAGFPSLLLIPEMRIGKLDRYTAYVLTSLKERVYI